MTDAPKRKKRLSRRYSKEEVGAALRHAKGMVSVAAQILGCEPSTIRRQIQRYPELGDIREESINHAIEVAFLVVLETLFKTPNEEDPQRRAEIERQRGQMARWLLSSRLAQTRLGLELTPSISASVVQVIYSDERGNG